MPNVELVLFGGFQLRRHGEPLPPIPSRTARSLFAAVLVARGVRHSREHLAAQFWPDLPPARARRRLSHTLWQIQDALSDVSGDIGLLEVTSDTLAVRPGARYRIDVEDFERGLDQLRARRDAGRSRSRDLADLEQIVELYQGDFLAGHYDGWVLDEQQRLEQRYLDALTWLVELAGAQGAYEDALGYARRLTSQDPLREDAHREVMRLSTLLGRTSEALRQYERCREVLAEELGTAPSEATERLHRRIQRQRQLGTTAPAAAKPDPLPERLPLLGRERERGEAIGVLEHALTGTGGTVLVEGDAGAGVTRFLAELVDDAAWRGFEVLRAARRGPEPPSPYAVVRQLLEPALTPLRIAQLLPRISPVWLGLVGQVIPSIVPALPPEHRHPPPVRREEGAQRLRHAIEATLLALAELDPLCLVVDDLQDVDEASLHVLAAVAAVARDHRLAVLLGYRGEAARARPPVWETVRDVDRRTRTVRLELGPLDAFTVAELVRVLGRGRGLDPAIAPRVWRETGGNPLFVVETLRAVAETAAATGDDGSLVVADPDELGALPLPGSIRELVLGRLAPLSRETRTVLDLLAIGGTGTDLATLETASELPAVAVVDAAGALVRRSLATEVTAGFGLQHDQIRRVILDALSPAELAALHRRVGAALERHHPDATARLAHHFSEAGATREAVTYLRRAGQEAVAVHDHAAADGYLSAALAAQHGGPVSLAARAELVAEHEAVLDVLGDRQRQRAAVAEFVALAAGTPDREREALRRRASLEVQVGELAAAESDARRALDLAVAGTGAYGEVLLTLAHVLALAGRRSEAVPVFELALAQPDLDPLVELEARTTAASVLRELQRFDEAAEELTEVLALAAARGLPREEAQALGVLGTIRMETGHGAEAAELYGRAIERCRAIGFRRGEGIHLVNEGVVRYWRGQVAGALTSYALAADVFAQLEDHRGVAAVRLNVAAACHGILGDDVRAERELDAALAHFTADGDVLFEAATRDVKAAVAIRAGALDVADAELERALALPGVRDHVWTTCQLLQRRVELRLAQGRVEDAMRDVAEGTALAETHHLAEVRGGFRSLAGVVHLAAGDGAAAVDAAADAVAAVAGGAERSYLVHLRHRDALAAVGRDAEAAAAAARAAEELRATLADLDEDQRRRAALVPEHRRILQLAGSGDGDVLVADVRTFVAAAGAPRGRALRPVELVEVAIDLDPGPDAPADPVQRRRALLRRVADQVVAQGGAATVGDLSRLLEVSEATVRRDLQALRRAGDAIETRGARSG